jgi:prepilin signal peptidase PulO-like enzyme (type II secretory pathway)
MRPFPEGLIAVLFCVICYVVTIFFCYNDYIVTFRPMHLAVIFLVIPVLNLVMMADKLNRIIPDQFSIYIALCGVLSVAADLLEGSVWFTPNAAWWIPLLNKIIASVIGGGAIWLIGFLSITFLGREGMGMGDMWLLFATGLITGCYGLVILVYVSIFSALIFAVPLIIRKRKRIAAEKKRIAEAEDPRAEKLKLQREKAKIHFAEDPDYMAFGPFLALGCAVFAIMEPFFFEKMLDMIQLLGVRF